MHWSPADAANAEIREKAIDAWQATDRYEPRILESIVAVLYLLLGGENFWIARILMSLIWAGGGWVLYQLARKLTGPGGGLFSLGYYLFLPFSIQASRSFQPDVLMVVGLICTAYLLLRWSEERSWKFSVFAGAMGGLTILVKAQGIFAVSTMALLAVWMTCGVRAAITDRKVWGMAALMLAFPAAYYLSPLPLQGGAGSYFATFTIAMSSLLKDPGFFVRWANFVHDFVDVAVIVLAFIGSLFFSRKGKPIAIGLWLGYALLGLFFPWQIHTHDYYSLALVPTVALGLAPIGTRLIEGIRQENRFAHVLFIAACIFAMAYPAWIARSGLLGSNYRNEPGAWRKMGEELPAADRMIALTHDYGWRLWYWGYLPVDLWPYQADFALHYARGGNLGADVQPLFNQLTEGKDFFLVTLNGELDAAGRPEETAL